MPPSAGKLPFLCSAAPAVYKFRVLGAQDFCTMVALNGQKKSSTSQHWRCIKMSLPIDEGRVKGKIRGYLIFSEFF